MAWSGNPTCNVKHYRESQYRPTPNNAPQTPEADQATNQNQYNKGQQDTVATSTEPRGRAGNRPPVYD